MLRPKMKRKSATPTTLRAETAAQTSTGPHYGSLIEYPKDPPARSGEALVLEDESASIDQKFAATSTEPGIYLLSDRAGKVLYVGKAKSLRPRVRAYFREGGDGRFQVRFLMKRVRDFDTIVTASEKEALILENNLIKQYKPRYNIRLKDDKSYLSAKVTNHAWPRITVTRKIVKDGGRYFGPFGSADGLRETIDVIRKVFPLRTCTDAVFRNRSRPCLEYQIKRCLGPCCLPVDREEYGRHLHAPQMLLEGKNLELLREMRDQMKDHASRLEFEDAARIRDRVKAIEKTVERQTVLHHWGIDRGRVRNLPRGRLHRGDRADRARRQADQHPGMELPGPGISGARNSLGSAHAVLLGRAQHSRRSDRAGRARGRRRARGAAHRAARKEVRSYSAAAR